MADAPLRPQMRALASIPVEIAVQTGAALRPEARPVFTAEARWDGKAQGEAWSVAAMKAIEEAPRDLTDLVPADIDGWCPGYEDNPAHLRAAFWVGTVSALARFESNFNPQAQGGGGAWQGLLQITPSTARLYGCDATTAAELRDGVANLQCAIRIMSRTVTRDGVVSAGDEGIAADWGPMSNPNLREQMRDWVSQQSYCEKTTAVMASLRPVARPESEIPETMVASAEIPHGDLGIPMAMAFLETSP
ncbi:transglycosylase SLT domain-containing protein [Rubellimicrobium mesophilum]|nr:transglycosylase SLT domain-containing protein [Rubellimicrobium mesophilum]